MRLTVSNQADVRFDVKEEFIDILLMIKVAGFQKGIEKYKLRIKLPNIIKNIKK